jgi:hypothetical protein
MARPSRGEDPASDGLRVVPAEGLGAVGAVPGRAEHQKRLQEATGPSTVGKDQRAGTDR